MMIIWFLAAIALLVAGYYSMPRKRDVHEPTPEELLLEKQRRYELFLKEEKDTKRFFEDIRSLYPL
jgi:hypothetical protein